MSTIDDIRGLKVKSHASPTFNHGKEGSVPMGGPAGAQDTVCMRTKFCLLEIESRYLRSPALCLLSTLDVAVVMPVWYKNHTKSPLRFLSAFYT